MAEQLSVEEGAPFEQGEASPYSTAPHPAEPPAELRTQGGRKGIIPSLY